MDLLDTTGKRVKELRRHHGWTQQELAERVTALGATASNSHISIIEAGHRKPSMAVLTALARALGTTTDYLTLLSDDSARETEPVFASGGPRE